VVTFLKLIIDKEGALNLNWDDDLVKGTAVTHDGQIVNERVKQALQS
jgi:NAD(P) transhydrogenase subunit alpha